MATIEVNNQRIDFNEQNYLNLKSLLPKLQRQFPIDEFNIGAFKVNGQNIDIHSEHPSLVRPIEHKDHIEILFQQFAPQTHSVVLELSCLTDKIISKIEICTDFYKSEDDLTAQLHLGQIIDAVDIFIHTISHILKNGIDLTELEQSVPVKELQIHLLSVLKAISNAHNKSDLIMLTDLLEYELKDNLTQWKILIIPILRNQMR